MRYLLLAIALLLSGARVSAQQLGRFSLEANYGLNGNFFVRSYDEINVPQPATVFLKKQFVGNIGGLELRYRLSKASFVGIGYARSVNAGRANVERTRGQDLLLIRDFTIRHVNHFYQAFYEGSLTRRNTHWRYQVGGTYIRPQQQEIEVYGNFTNISERNFRNSRLEELGVFAGLQYTRPIDTHVELGLRTRVYYLLSTSAFEAVTLTPTLTYTFR